MSAAVTRPLSTRPATLALSHSTERLTTLTRHFLAQRATYSGCDSKCVGVSEKVGGSKYIGQPATVSSRYA